ncbi:phosphatidylserine synthase, partial [Amycolatopsis vancoresmycina DSM 44592]
SPRRLGLRPPLRRRVAGAAMRAVRLPRETARTPRVTSENGQRRRSWRQIGLRRK